MRRQQIYKPEAFVREFGTSWGASLPIRGSLTDDIVSNASRHPNRVSFNRNGNKTWEPVTAKQFHDEVRAVAKGIIASGIERDARVALLSRTRYEWTLFDYAIWYAGAVSVPIYESSSSHQLAAILADSGATAMVVDSPEHATRLADAQMRLSGLEHTWVVNDGAVGHLTQLGALVSDEQVDRRRAQATPDSIATIIYTSGTTGLPKGCALTHGNFMFEVSAAVEALGKVLDPGSSTLIHLPLAHVFTRVIQVGAVKAGVRLGYAPDLKSLDANLIEFKPTFLFTIPRVLERLFNAASRSAHIEGSGSQFDKAVETAIAYSRALDDDRPHLVLRARHAVRERLVYARIRQALGGECTHVICGGAPLGERLGHVFRGIGVEVLEGYGLTETTGAVTVNRPGLARIGSVGQPLPGTTVRVADDGELLVRGGQVVGCYRQDPQGSSGVFDADGWFRTGDLGVIDDEGFIWITGRQKEMLVTAGGKNVAPAPLEERIRAHPLVSQCLVLGDGRPFISALVTLDGATAVQWAADRGKPTKLSALAADPDIHREIQSAVDDANRAVSQAESVRRFTILECDWTEDSGELTASLKVRRGAVLKRHHRAVETMYDH